MGKRRNPNNPPKAHQFKPGQSGNPGGVAGGKKVSTWLIELGQLAELPDADTLPINGRIALARINDALQPGGDRSTALILDRTEGKLTDIKPLPPAAPEISPERRAEIMATLDQYEECGETMYCLGCKGIHGHSWTGLNGIATGGVAGRIIGGPDCSLTDRESRRAPIDPQTGYAYDPDYHPEKRYDTKTGREIIAPGATPDAHPFLDAALEEAIAAYRRNQPGASGRA